MISPAVMIPLSLAVNIVVLITVCTVLIAYGSSEPVVYSWGEYSASRGILLSIYFSILIASASLLFFFLWNPKLQEAVEHMVVALLTVQICYKITTPLTVRISNPIVISNLCISLLHAATLWSLWQARAGGAHIERKSNVVCDVTDEVMGS